ncbi:MAG TPA: universal stress protein [Xanthobacteraceae bacterium]|jgi:nucleotide-binding universal stress UspA family protein|nr:universal stress protein [Xanthobacteraceae bacterium]
MIKDIVVNLGLGERGSPAGDYAISVADAFDAHVVGISFLYDPIVPVSATGYIPAEVIETQRSDNEAAAKAAVDRFTAAASRAGVSAEQVTLSASLAGAGDTFGRIARRYDLAIVGQAEPGMSSVEEIIAESTLFESGRPMIVVPYIQKAPLKLDNVMVCWDGSRPAARAIADAMPLLEKAGRVEVVIIANERGKQDEIEGADLGQHLARHGLKVEVNRMAGGKIDVADALLSHLADSSADFIVMGGYGHSRLREFVLGGVTHSILRSMTAPVLMAH